MADETIWPNGQLVIVENTDDPTAGIGPTDGTSLAPRVVTGTPGAPGLPGADGDTLPDQTGNNGKFLTTNGTNPSWATVVGMGIGNAITSATPGSVLFADASGNLGQDNANFQYDATAHVLGVENLDSIGSVLTIGGTNGINGSINTVFEWTQADTTVESADGNSLAAFITASVASATPSIVIDAISTVQITGWEDPAQAGSASAIGVIAGSSETLSNAAARLVSFRNNGSEKAAVLSGGGLLAPSLDAPTLNTTLQIGGTNANVVSIFGLASATAPGSVSIIGGSATAAVTGGGVSFYGGGGFSGGSGGSLVLKGGVVPTGSGVGGTAYLQGGWAGGGGAGGDTIIEGGWASGGTHGKVKIGTSTTGSSTGQQASEIDIGHAGITTTFAGSVSMATLGPSAAQQHTLPAVASDTFALLAASQALTNKTISGASNTLSNIPESAVTGLVSDLAAKATDSLVVHLAGSENITGVKTFLITGVGTAQTAGAALSNTTAAANNAQQYSPMLELVGNGWLTSLNASTQAKWGIQTRPVQGTFTTFAADLVFWENLGGLGYNERWAMKFNGTNTILQSPNPIKVIDSSSGGSGIEGDNANNVYLLSNGTRIAQANLFSAAFYPSADNTYALGLAGNRWSTIYGVAHNSAGSSMTFGNTVANGSTAVGYIFDTTNNFTTAGARIVSFRSAGDEKIWITSAGGPNGNGGIYMKYITPMDIGLTDSTGTTLRDGFTFNNSGISFYTGGTARMSLTTSEFYSQTDGVIQLGDASHNWKSLYIANGSLAGGNGIFFAGATTGFNTTDANNLYAYQNGSLRWLWSNTGNFSNNNLLAYSDNTWTLGDATHRWSTIYGVNATLGNLVVTDGTTQTQVISAGGLGQVGTVTNHPLSFFTNNTTRLSLSGSGGTTTLQTPAATTFKILDASNNGVSLPTGSTGVLLQVGGFAAYQFDANGAKPVADNTYTAGDGTHRFSTIYGVAGNFGAVSSGNRLEIDANGTATKHHTNMGTAQVYGLALITDTAATSGAANQQYSPGLQWTGQQYNGSASVATDFMAQLRPITGATNAGDLVFWSRYNAGSWAEQFSVIGNNGIPAIRVGANAGGASGSVYFGDGHNQIISSGSSYISLYVNFNQIAFFTPSAVQAGTDNTISMGDATHRWSTVYSPFLDSGASNLGITGNGKRVNLSTVAFYPDTDLGIPLGFTNNRWSGLYLGPDAVGTAQTVGLSMVNKTASADTTHPQYSPMLSMLGTVVETTGSTSQTAGWAFQAQGLNPATTTAISELWFYQNVNGSLTKMLGFAKAGSSANAATLFNANKTSRLDLEGGDARLSANNSSIQVNYNFANSVEMNVNGTLNFLALPGVNRANTDLTIDLGDSTHRWSTVYAANIDGGSSGGVNINAPSLVINLKANGTTKMALANSGGNWQPGIDKDVSMGSASFRWNGNYAYWYDTKLGAQLTAAATITPTSGAHHVTGATTIDTIATTNVPASGTVELTLIADGGTITLSAAGNVKVACTIAQDTFRKFFWDGSKWYPHN